MEWGRANFNWFLFTSIFPKLYTNPNYPGAAAIIDDIKALWQTFYTASGAKNYALMDQIYESIKTK